MSMLSEILATKRTDIAFSRQRQSLQCLQERLVTAPPTRDFVGALRRASRRPALIAEVKKASPSKGVIREDFDPVSIAKIYVEGGAACLSVLTDEKYFQGRLSFLSCIRESVEVPLMRKDFIIDPWQIIETRLAGADALLLIVAALCPADLRSLLALSREYGLAALVEAHDREELLEAIDAGATLIGINNRDLHTFRTNICVTVDLLRDLPPDPNRIIVSESGIFTHADVLRLAEAGVDAVLIGEAFMREPDIAAKMRAVLGTYES